MAVSIDELTVGGGTVSVGGDIGYTKAGVTQTPGIELFEIDGIEQLTVSPEAWIVSRSFEISFTMLQPTIDNLILSWDLPDAASGATPKIVPICTTQSFTPTEKIIIVTGIQPGASRFVRTVTYNKCVLSSPAPVFFGKSAETNFEQTWKCLWDGTTVGGYSDAGA